DKHTIPINEFRENAYRIVEPRLLTNIIAGQVVKRVDFARVPDSERHAKVAQLGILATRHELSQRLERIDRLAAAAHLPHGQVMGIGPIDLGYVHQVEIGEVALVAHRAPGSGNGMQVRRDDAGLESLLERLAQEGRKQL